MSAARTVNNDSQMAARDSYDIMSLMTHQEWSIIYQMKMNLLYRVFSLGLENPSCLFAFDFSMFHIKDQTSLYFFALFLSVYMNLILHAVFLFISYNPIRTDIAHIYLQHLKVSCIDVSFFLVLSEMISSFDHAEKEYPVISLKCKSTEVDVFLFENDVFQYPPFFSYSFDYCFLMRRMEMSLVI